MKLVEDAVDEMIDNLKVYRTWNNVGVRGVVNLRLDIELDDKSLLWGVLKHELQKELKDVVSRGDVESTDPMLSAFDGEKKLKQKLTGFAISSAILEQSGDDQSTLYTLYFKVYVEFDKKSAPIREVAASKKAFSFRSQEFA